MPTREFLFRAAGIRIGSPLDKRGGDFGLAKTYHGTEECRGAVEAIAPVTR